MCLGRLTWLLLCVVSCGWLPSLAAQSSQWVLPDLPGPLVQRVLFDSAAAGQQVSCYVSLPPSMTRSHSGVIRCCTGCTVWVMAVQQ
ncbi:MAG UNVERIFIED_CONTAM: hypothetical protein LVR18_25010 [Planctomycetaceae bacterium]